MGNDSSYKQPEVCRRMSNERNKEERVAVKIRKSRIEVGTQISISFVVPATIRMDGRIVTRDISPNGDSVIEYTNREEAEAAVIAAGFRPVY
jgi:hypothetical protein